MIEQPNMQDGLTPKSLIWRRNCPYLYSMLYVSELDWPSLTVDWVSAYEANNIQQDEQTVYNMLLGTHSNEEQNYILLAKVRVSNQQMLRKKYEREPPNKNDTVRKNDQMMPDKIQIQGWIPHDGEVNRIRHNPHNYTQIASRTPYGEVHIFNSKNSRKDQKFSPQQRLTGHDTEGYALQWNPNKEWNIISGSYDGKIGLWDINKKQNKGNTVSPLSSFNSFHQKQVEDLSFNKFHESIFLSCDDAGLTAFWDTRNHAKMPSHQLQCHQGVQYGVQFSPSTEYAFASCGSDSLVKVWDIRNTNDSLFCCRDLKDQEITQVHWSRQDPTTLWSVAGPRATLWDMSSQTAKFVHAGHRQNEEQESGVSINELSVNINQPDTVAVVDSNNEIQVFQPNQNSKM